ncbi:Phosphatidylethanolamine N-methyltransferase [Zancudomyces culisetae]|uniref:Phosphatidylethanolamine N-methyltransferase n=1 Tax=Zancudomyces culisetae TaxID=1213189 RepID=A0A1R1PF37_ZANCU|nr:Phosphatidylethanolamine N-methyltransferase [Zancudomyces culisetae]|eukprot:OMH79528.1 Phosphatidylethanolamine N-methyltransferase [Zancudomyces culisetae]
MSGSWTVFTLALSLQILLMVFYEFIEGPHMKKLYGQQIRVDSGITKTIKKAINENSLAKLIVYDFPKRMGSNQDMSTLAGFGSGSHSQDNKDVGGDFNVSNLVKPLFDVKKPLKEMVNETRAFIGSTSRRLAQNIIPPSLKGIKNLELYKFELVNSRKDKDMRNSEPSDSKIVYELGEPITIRWEAPVTHLRNDWVGIYPVTSNPSPAITTVPSKGQYVYVHPDEKLMSGFVQGDCMFTGACDGLRDAKSEHEVSSSHKLDSAEDSVASTGKKEVYYGSAVFSGNSLPWKAGTYEMRYHHGESHNVIAISPAFEISASLNDLQYDQSDLKALISKLFLKILNRCTSVTVTINVDDLDSSPILKYKSFFDSSSDSLPIKPANIDEDSHESQILESNGGANSKALFLDKPRWRSKVIEPMKELSDPIGISGSLEPSVAKRLAYCISAYFKIGYSSEVLTKAAKNNLSAATIADHIYNSKLALESFSKNQADSLAILE